jgi:hypothetical protein
MKKVLVLFTIILFAGSMYAHSGSLGIGISTPNSNVSVDIGATNKGFFFLNHVALTPSNNATPLTSGRTVLL